MIVNFVTVKPQQRLDLLLTAWPKRHPSIGRKPNIKSTVALMGAPFGFGSGNILLQSLLFELLPLCGYAGVGNGD